MTLTLAVTTPVHPALFVTVYDTVVEPVVRPVTTPVAEIVATAVLEEVQTPPAVALANWVVAPKHTFVAPVSAATATGVETVTV